MIRSRQFEIISAFMIFFCATLSFESKIILTWYFKAAAAAAVLGVPKEVSCHRNGCELNNNNNKLQKPNKEQHLTFLEFPFRKESKHQNQSISVVTDEFGDFYFMLLPMIRCYCSESNENQSQRSKMSARMSTTDFQLDAVVSLE